MLIHIWLLPIAILVTTTALAFPLSRFLAWIMDGKYKPLPVFRWAEDRLHSGPQNWKQYTASILIFNTVLFVFGFVVLWLQPWMPLNPDGTMAERIFLMALSVTWMPLAGAMGRAGGSTILSVSSIKILRRCSSFTFRRPLLRSEVDNQPANDE